MKYKLGEHGFRVKQEIKDMYRGILDRYPKNSIPDREDQIDIWHLFRNHPSYEEKKGVGVKRFEVRIGPPYQFQNKCFYVVRNDDTFDDFSYTACINNVKKVL